MPSLAVSDSHHPTHPVSCNLLNHRILLIKVCSLLRVTSQLLYYCKVQLNYLKDNQVVSDSVRPHGLQPTRLPCPWDSPGNNTGVGCHFLLQCRNVESESEVAESCPTLCDPMDCSLSGSSAHGIFQARVLEWVAIGFSGFMPIDPISVRGDLEMRNKF